MVGNGERGPAAAKSNECFVARPPCAGPTNKKFHIEFCTVAHWKNGEIIEEKLFYDLVGLLKQIGVM
ncbi:MAG: ester cyclase [Chthoniobacterales bacterium]